MLMLAMPWVSVLLIFFWVGNMIMLQGPGSHLQLIVVVTIAGTAILGAAEASQFGMERDPKLGGYGPVGWFLLMIIIWAVAYPAYLFHRRKYGARSYLFLAIVTVVVFAGSAWLMQSSIDSTMAEIKHNLDSL
ncbi:hypothetical protein LQ772_06870 [Frateuria edaphi]|uniref:hypothetical protein n=1 Tax=Frateuria edaphi TaxID=2898793 RepID=UPI001E47588C|nr:hypothetical protein [Frateuria edaphi]UGB47008.1 hypothetical protein LQ772_06870 [Frateuria edaphi]